MWTNIQHPRFVLISKQNSKQKYQKSFDVFALNFRHFKGRQPIHSYLCSASVYISKEYHLSFWILFCFLSKSFSPFQKHLEGNFGLMVADEQVNILILKESKKSKRSQILYFTIKCSKEIQLMWPISIFASGWNSQMLYMSIWASLVFNQIVALLH